jgi:hypothetical protein
MRNNNEHHPTFPSLAKPHHDHHSKHNYSAKNRYHNDPHHYSSPPVYTNYSIYDFYEKLPETYFNDKKHLYVTNKTNEETFFKIYMGGVSIVGLYIFYRLLEK